MKEKKTLTELIQSKLGEKSFAYQPGHWEQAAAQMVAWEAEDRRKRRLIWLWMLVGLVAIATLGIGAMGMVLWDANHDQLAIENSPIPALAEAKGASPSQHILDQYTAEPTPIAPECVPCPQVRRKPIRNWVRRNKNKVKDWRERRKQRKNPIAKIPFVAPDSTSDFKIRPVTCGGVRCHLTSDFSPFLWRPRYDCRYNPNLHIFVQSGNAFSFQTINESGGSPAIANPQFGLGVRLAIRPRVALESGLFYHQTQFSGLQAQFSATEYNFAATQNQVNWKPQQMHWLDIPLQLHLRPFKRHELYIGGSFQYLLTTRSELESRSNNPFGPGSTESQKAWGYHQGLATWNASLQGGYRLYLGSRLGLDLSYQHGLRNLVRDEAFGANRQRFDRQLKVGMIYFIR